MCIAPQSIIWRNCWLIYTAGGKWTKHFNLLLTTVSIVYNLTITYLSTVKLEPSQHSLFIFQPRKSILYTAWGFLVKPCVWCRFITLLYHNKLFEHNIALHDSIRVLHSYGQTKMFTRVNNFLSLRWRIIFPCQSKPWARISNLRRSIPICKEMREEKKALVKDDKRLYSSW